MATRVLLTGANGFVGSHIADALLREGYEVSAMVRTTSNLQWLERKPVELVYGSLDDPASLRRCLEGVDAVIHNAGVVATSHSSLYYLHNTEGTRNLLDAVADVATDISRFVYVSSQAAGGPTKTRILRRESDTPAPITAYGHSKLLAEKQVFAYGNKFPVTVIRPPAIYGPRDKAWLPLFALISSGWLPLIGRYRELTLTHAQDLANQILLQLEHKNAVNEIFHCAPYDPVTFEDLGDTISMILSAAPRIVTIPDWIIRHVYPLVHPMIRMVGVKPPFQIDKLPDVLAHRWTISGEKAADQLGYKGRLPLEAGIGQTAEWYRWKEWLKTARDRNRDANGPQPDWRSVNGVMRRYDANCDLCALAFDGEIKTHKHYEDDDFIIVDCLICQVPMAVLKDHRPRFTDEEKKRLMKVFEELFGSEHHPDFEQRRIPDHAHVHYRATPHLLPWQRRPD